MLLILFSLLFSSQTFSDEGNDCVDCANDKKFECSIQSYPADFEKYNQEQKEFLDKYNEILTPSFNLSKAENELRELVAKLNRLRDCEKRLHLPQSWCSFSLYKNTQKTVEIKEREVIFEVRINNGQCGFRRLPYIDRVYQNSNGLDLVQYLNGVWFLKFRTSCKKAGPNKISIARSVAFSSPDNGEKSKIQIVDWSDSNSKVSAHKALNFIFDQVSLDSDFTDKGIVLKLSNGFNFLIDAKNGKVIEQNLFKQDAFEEGKCQTEFSQGPTKFVPKVEVLDKNLKVQKTITSG